MRKKKNTEDNRNVSLPEETGYTETEKPVYRGRYEKESDGTQFSYETGPISSYQGRYAADTDTSYKTDSVEEYEDYYHARHEAGSLRPAAEIPPSMPYEEDDEDDTASEMIGRSMKRADDRVRAEKRRSSSSGKKNGRTRKKKKRSGTSRDTWIKSGSLILSLVLMLAMILNMPILWYKKSGQPDERVSIISYFKKWQPTVEIEGELQQNSMDLKIKSDVIESEYTDGLDLPQLVEGQYSVLFVGFDETEQLTDVVWVCQFDIGGGMLNILQIPRDLAVPDYTNSPTCKFNSIYTEGDYYV